MYLHMAIPIVRNRGEIMEKEDIPLILLLVFVGLIIGIGGFLTIISIFNIIEWVFRS